MPCVNVKATKGEVKLKRAPLRLDCRTHELCRWGRAVRDSTNCISQVTSPSCLNSLEINGKSNFLIARVYRQRCYFAIRNCACAF